MRKLEPKIFQYILATYYGRIYQNRRVVVLYVIISLRDFITQCGIKRDKGFFNITL